MWVISHLYLSMNFSQHGSSPKSICIWSLLRKKAPFIMKITTCRFFFFFFFSSRGNNSPLWCLLPWPILRSSTRVKASSTHGRLVCTLGGRAAWGEEISAGWDSPKQPGSLLCGGVGEELYASIHNIPLISKRGLWEPKTKKLTPQKNKCG